MSDPAHKRHVTELCADQDQRWAAGERPTAENYLASYPWLAADSEPLLDLIYNEVVLRESRGEQPTCEEFVARFPDLAIELRAQFEVHAAIQDNDPRAATARPKSGTPEPSAMNESEWTIDEPPRRDVPPSQVEDEATRTTHQQVIVGNGPTAREEPPTPVTPPQNIDRYRVERLLGQGGFGLVFLAHDDQLQRLVAIKVPHRHRIPSSDAAGAYLSEARTVASLDHPNIVSVHDVGSTEEFPCFIVSKYIEGSTLEEQIKTRRLSWIEATDLVATVAEALHHAHRKGLVHRDIKPGNIILDKQGKPFVVDFGLALKEEDVGYGPKFAGTPAYMSPEQARGEGHRVDGRSDIYSLGVIFYELLTGRRPFAAVMVAELLEQITTFEPRPPRQVDDRIPKELERICLKSLSKRASERYTTAKDMADDLRRFQAEQTAISMVRSSGPHSIAAGTPLPSSFQTSRSIGTTHATDIGLLKIVPKGLRSFDAHDADFFLELLPGPRNRDGLPESIRFWKTRIEETDAADTFAVGLIYGPSGCGKSSLVKAGLLPHLSDEVLVVYVEATADETETRLLQSLRKRCPKLPADLSLKDMLAAIRRGPAMPGVKKVLIVLDQFEQWLHAKQETHSSELVPALRQCDGSRLQCLVMVRDDFWLAVSRFLRELEIRLVEGQNSSLVDLFDVDHARKVLAAFGRAFGKIPDNPSEMSRAQKEFLNQAVSGLSQDGKVISVRLALFAEMMKGKAWTLASLKEVGGTEGVGAAFLEETFSAASATPEHRYHQKAARAVLRALLPEAGTEIRGHVRSHSELLIASGYENRPKDFDDLIRILDSEVRLITPTDPGGPVAIAEPAATEQLGQQYFQLTHDYLVPSLREWLTRKQKETRRGRAELLLAERASEWRVVPENRQLPSFLQWLSIRWLTSKQAWTPTERKIMRKARRYFLVRITALGILLLGSAITVLSIRDRIEAEKNSTQAEAMVQRLLDAEIGQVPDIVDKMAAYRHWTDPILRQNYDTAEPRQKLHIELALLPVDVGQREALFARLLSATPSEVRVIRDALLPHKDEFRERLWVVAETPTKGQEQERLRAAAALATYDPDNERWAHIQDAVAGDFVKEPSVYLATWLEILQLEHRKLLAPLGTIFRDINRRETERSLATEILAFYAADKPAVLADLLMDADDKQFAVLFPKLIAHGERGLQELHVELDKKSEPNAPDGEKERMAKRQANAAVALLKASQAVKVWPLSKHSPDPRRRSYLIHRLGPFGADPKVIVEHMAAEPELSIRLALLLSLGEFSEQQLSQEERRGIESNAKAIYLNEADSGLHAAAEWLLRRWQQGDWLKQQDAELIKAHPAPSVPPVKPQWYFNSRGQEMIAIPGPVEFQMGAPIGEAGRSDYEPQHQRRIGRTFALAAKPVTVAEYCEFNPSFQFTRSFAPTPDCPIVGTSWYEAADYCIWLSKEEGIAEEQLCYEVDSRGHAIKLKEKYLSLTGYRLPTEAELEYATRAGATTCRYYGETDELLKHYSWYQGNSGFRAQPIGTKKPNDLGFFDLLGNVSCWCQDRYTAYPVPKNDRPIDDVEGVLTINPAQGRVYRGGSFLNPSSSVRSAARSDNVPSAKSNNNGFRIARTLFAEK